MNLEEASGSTGLSYPPGICLHFNGKASALIPVFGVLIPVCRGTGAKER